MKHLLEDWELEETMNGDGQLKNDSKFILIHTEYETISFISEKELKDMFVDDPDGKGDIIVKMLLSLKIGKSYSPDGGINVYLRIRK